MAPLPTIYVRQSVSSGIDLLDGRSVPVEAAIDRPYALETRELRKIVGLTPDAIPEPGYFGNFWGGGPDTSQRYSQRPAPAPAPGPGGVYDARPLPMTHNPAVDLTPGRVPMGQVGPPGSSFFQTHKTKFYIAGGVIAIAAVGFFGFKWWKKRKAAAE
ncbi:hypothetical protein FLAG1_08439 [Fusarium langsethiae]|uniref:Uncharacterized protein n=1 Tax=Fusarium langsethiae TaxID=179993 RepID=A0A0M9ES61_FUSLA|nr:hypothetical protein FLAG1_08439 [Fusarium langsethiae]GKU05559.1 unnamed protein product [Fusarium langsethiae]GKU11411.1 unnamed protein product [Fusarium langsethiae]